MKASHDFNSLTDEQLMDEYNVNGTENAYAVLYARYFDKLVKFIFDLYIRDFQAAEDIVQHTFLSIHSKDYWCLNRKDGGTVEKPLTYQSGKSFSKWLYSVAGNWAIRQTALSKQTKRGGKHVIESLHREERSGHGIGHQGSSLNEPTAKTDTIEMFVPDSNGGGKTSFRPEAVYEIIEALSDEQRQVIELHYYESKSEREVATELNMSRHQVRRVLHEAHDVLKSKLVQSEVLA